MKLRLTLAFLVIMMLTMVGSSSAQSDLTGQLEIFSWWAGDEGPALEALITLYTTQNPGVEVIFTALRIVSRVVPTVQQSYPVGLPIKALATFSPRLMLFHHCFCRNLLRTYLSGLCRKIVGISGDGTWSTG
jgi:hypothetical protein